MSIQTRAAVAWKAGAPLTIETLDLEGPRDGEPVLCVHGNPTWSFIWRRLIRELSPHRRVIAVDHIGCGFSDKPQDYPYRLEQHVTNLRRLIESLDLKEITRPEIVAKWWLPERWTFVESIPKTSVGKFDKKVLRKAYADEELAVEVVD